MSQASLVMKKICDGFQSTELARLAASIVVTTPFQWSYICDSISQFQQRVKSTHLQQNVHAMAVPQREKKVPCCWKCGQDHLLKDFRAIVCRFCGDSHQQSKCAKNGERTFCNICKSKFHNQAFGSRLMLRSSEDLTST